MRRPSPWRVSPLPLVVALATLLAGGSARTEQVAAAGERPASAGAAAQSPEGEAAPAATDTEGVVRLVGDPAMGATKAAVCGGCHGPDGNAPVPQFPKLAGQRSDYVEKQLRDFKAGQRSDPVMAGMAAMLSDQDIADVAAYFESRAVRSGAGTTELAAAGETLYSKGRPENGLFPCIGCHGPNGEGANGAIEGGFPAVGGQNPEYLAKQLKSFRDSARANDWKGIMQIVASRMSDEDIAAVIAYLAALPRVQQGEAPR